MNQTIFITNIGNRNIKYKGEKIETSKFRAITQKIYENIDTEEPFVSIEILENYIGQSNIDTIYIIVTNQNDPKFNYQDTYFEGLIIKSILEKNNPFGVKLLEVNENPTDEHVIFNILSKFLKEIKVAHPVCNIIYNDAGGTPQLKSVIRTLIEFYFDKGQYAFYYVDQNNNKREIEKSNHNKYEFLKLALEFCNKYHFDAAVDVLEKIETKDMPKYITRYVNFTADRFNFNRENVKANTKEFNSPNSPLNEFYYYGTGKTGGEILPNLPLSDKEKSDIFEIAAICQIFFKTGNYTLGVATYYRLIEELSISLVKLYNKSEKYNFNRTGDQDRFMAQYVEEIKMIYPDIASQFGLPFQLAFCAIKYSDHSTKQLINTIQKTVSHFNTDRNKGINLLRNRCFIAHKNNSITLDSINKEVPDFLSSLLPVIFNSLNMPKDNIYDMHNKMILQLIMKI